MYHMCSGFGLGWHPVARYIVAQVIELFASAWRVVGSTPGLVRCIFPVLIQWCHDHFEFPVLVYCVVTVGRSQVSLPVWSNVAFSSPIYIAHGKGVHVWPNLLNFTPWFKMQWECWYGGQGSIRSFTNHNIKVIYIYNYSLYIYMIS